MNHTLLLTGLSGSNPLAYLAALGALRMLPEARLHWRLEQSVWRPVLTLPEPASSDGLCQRLLDLSRRIPAHLEKLRAVNLTVPPKDFSAYMNAVQDDPDASSYAAAFASEVCIADQKDRVEYTNLCFITGSGHQDFITTVVRLSRDLSLDQLREALFERWRYADKSLSFRWDPQDAAEYALRASDPSKDGAWTVWGANRLAFEALPLFPVQPTQKGLRTTAFRKNTNREEFTWPLWDTPLAVDAVRSLLSYPELQEKQPNRALLRAMGIAELFRAPRIRIGQGANFKVSFRPARAV
ncbi:MAG TPA: hypothetical protein VFQ91_10155 [Bryobacteraceae bacterium]|nr:hypothetical protein [Bryobacteraceae bacterium]